LIAELRPFTFSFNIERCVLFPVIFCFFVYFFPIPCLLIYLVSGIYSFFYFLGCVYLLPCKSNFSTGRELEEWSWKEQTGQSVASWYSGRPFTQIVVPKSGIILELIPKLISQYKVWDKRDSKSKCELEWSKKFSCSNSI
jgi:hypothetical protein